MTIIKKQVFSRQDKTLSGRQNLIKEIVTAYEKLHPEQAREAGQHAKLMRNTRAKPTGEMVRGGSEIEMVFSLTLPGVLMRALQKLITDPPIFHEQAELRWFKREFKQYSASEKI
jgi:hypothetical protein